MSYVGRVLSIIVAEEAQGDQSLELTRDDVQIVSPCMFLPGRMKNSTRNKSRRPSEERWKGGLRDMYLEEVHPRSGY